MSRCTLFGMNRNDVRLRAIQPTENTAPAPAVASQQAQPSAITRHPLQPALLLPAESLALFALSIVLYFYLGGSWLMLTALLLAPDLSMLGYAWGPRLGAMTYNLLHNYALPCVLVTIGLLASTPLAVHIALIWFAHIAIDRALGYGLKHESGFGDTHLGAVGRGWRRR